MDSFLYHTCLRREIANVDRLTRFRTGASNVFTTQKLFPKEIPLTMKTATSNSL